MLIKIIKLERNGLDKIILANDGKSYVLDASAQADSTKFDAIWFIPQPRRKRVSTYLFLRANSQGDLSQEVEEISKDYSAERAVKHSLYPLAVYPSSLINPTSSQKTRLEVKNSAMLANLQKFLEEYIPACLGSKPLYAVAFYSPDESYRIFSVSSEGYAQTMERNLGSAKIISRTVNTPLGIETKYDALERTADPDPRARIFVDAYLNGTLFIPLQGLFSNGSINRTVAKSLYNAAERILERKNS